MRPEAIAELKRVIELDKKNVWAYGYIGLLFGEMDKIDTGISWIKKGLKIDPDVAALHMLLSSAYYKKDDSWGGFWEGVEALRLKALGF
jgi:tetratricopeptide (TPR) repeat protein